MRRNGQDVPLELALHIRIIERVRHEIFALVRVDWIPTGLRLRCAEHKTHDKNCGLLPHFEFLAVWLERQRIKMCDTNE